MHPQRSSVLGPEQWSDATFLDEGTAAFDGLPGRFCMFYQPDLDLRTDALGGCEALLRWWHPDFGMLRPAASLHGTRWDAGMVDIEDWAARAVSRQAMAWGRVRQGVQVALNVSRRHLVNEGFLDAMDGAIEASDVDPTLLAIDVPVAALATERDAVRSVCAGLVARGVTVILDGVGIETGLLELEDVEASVWKIEVWPANRKRTRLHPAVGGAVRRADKIGVATVAKAVEDDTILALVRDTGFDRAFGHAISPAITRAAMSALLRRPRSSPLVREPGQ